MKVVQWIIIFVAALFGLFLVVTFFLPKDYYVERSIDIKAPPVLVYGEVTDLDAWLEWNPWNDMDPKMSITFGDTKVGQGAWYSWSSDVAGNGKMTIVEAEAPTKVRYELLFKGYEDQPSYASILLSAPNPSGPTSVTWTFEGNIGDKFFARWMAVLMDKFVGNSYEKGLKSLKERCEGMMPGEAEG